MDKHLDRYMSQVSRWGVFEQASAAQVDFTPKQRILHGDYVALVESQGKFSQDPGPDGCGYLDDAANPWLDAGLMCQSCVFFVGNTCEIVTGEIVPQGVCRYGVFTEPDDSYLDDVAQRTIYDLDE